MKEQRHPFVILSVVGNRLHDSIYTRNLLIDSVPITGCRVTEQEYLRVLRECELKHPYTFYSGWKDFNYNTLGELHAWSQGGLSFDKFYNKVTSWKPSSFEILKKLDPSVDWENRINMFLNLQHNPMPFSYDYFDPETDLLGAGGRERIEIVKENLQARLTELEDPSQQKAISEQIDELNQIAHPIEKKKSPSKRIKSICRICQLAA